MSFLAQIYAVLAFAEILMLFASVIGLLVLALRLAVRAIDGLINAAINSSSRVADPRVGRLSRLKLAAEGRFHKIPGGHNEHF